MGKCPFPLIHLSWLTCCSYDRTIEGQDDEPLSPSAIDFAKQSGQAVEVSSVIRLQNGMVLYLREINKYVLPDVCVEPHFRLDLANMMH